MSDVLSSPLRLPVFVSYVDLATTLYPYMGGYAGNSTTPRSGN